MEQIYLGIYCVFLAHYYRELRKSYGITWGDLKEKMWLQT